MTDETPTADLEHVPLEQDDSGVVVEVTVTAPMATVRDHLRDPELIHRWHGWDARARTRRST